MSLSPTVPDEDAERHAEELARMPAPVATSARLPGATPSRIGSDETVANARDDCDDEELETLGTRHTYTAW